MSRSSIFNLIVLLVIIFALPLSVLLYTTASSKEELQNTQINLETIKKQRTEEEITPTPTPTPTLAPIDWESMQTEVDEILGYELKNYSYVIQDLESGEMITHQENENFWPASIYKVPLAVLILQEVDKGNINLTDYLTIGNIEYSFDELAKLGSGKKLTLEDTLSYMIRYSDNTAVRMIENKLGGWEATNSLLKDSLGLSDFSRWPMQRASSEQIRKVLFELYNDKLLKAETKEFLIDLMKSVITQHQDRIQAGIPAEAEVAHKIGNLDGIYQDAGIVYGKDRDFIIILLNRYTTTDLARSKISSVASTVYNYFNP